MKECYSNPYIIAFMVCLVAVSVIEDTGFDRL
jgi:hypothetical protein